LVASRKSTGILFGFCMQKLTGGGKLPQLKAIKFFPVTSTISKHTQEKQGPVVDIALFFVGSPVLLFLFLGLHMRNNE
jgi:hypothetical protein